MTDTDGAASPPLRAAPRPDRAGSVCSTPSRGCRDTRDCPDQCQRALDERHRFVELLSPFGQHVPERVQRVGVFRIGRDHLPEEGLGFGVFPLALERRRQLSFTPGCLGNFVDGALQRSMALSPLPAFICGARETDVHGGSVGDNVRACAITAIALSNCFSAS